MCPLSKINHVFTWNALVLMTQHKITKLPKNTASQGVMYDWSWLFTEPINLINTVFWQGQGPYKANVGTRQTEITTAMSTGSLRKMQQNITLRPNHKTPKGNFKKKKKKVSTLYLLYVYTYNWCWSQESAVSWWSTFFLFLFPQLYGFNVHVCVCFICTCCMCGVGDLYWFCSKL